MQNFLGFKKNKEQQDRTNTMLKRAFHLVILLLSTLSFPGLALAQTASQDSTRNTPQSTEQLTVNYTSAPQKYTIADIDVTGIEGTMYENQKFVLIGFSGLAKGQEIQIPGDDISNAIKRFWKQGLFSDVKILQTKIENDSVWLEIKLTDRPRVADIRYNGLKKSEREDIEKKIGKRTIFSFRNRNLEKETIDQTKYHI